MMAMPACDFGDLLVADRAETSLFLPEVEEPALSLKSRDHLHIKPFLKIRVPGGIVGIGFCTDLRMSFNTN